MAFRPLWLVKASREGIGGPEDIIKLSLDLGVYLKELKDAVIGPYGSIPLLPSLEYFVSAFLVN